MNDDDASNPIEVTFGEPARQRRWTVLIRGVLYLPQSVALWFVGIAAFFVVVYGWFAALLLGRVPRRPADFVLRYVRWQTRAAAYAYLLTDRYPPFSGRDDPEHPVRLDGSPGRLNRAAVLFRLVLVFPAAIWSSLLGIGLAVFSPITWIVTLVLGRIPRPIFEASAVTLRYATRANAYTYLVTSAWPWGSFGDRALPGGDPFPPVPPVYPPPVYPPPVPPAYPPPSYPPAAPSPVPPVYPPPGSPVYPPPVYPPPTPPVYPPAAPSPVPPVYPPPGSPVYPPPGSPVYPPPVPPSYPVPTPGETVEQETGPSWRLVASTWAKVLLVVFALLGLVTQAVYYSAAVGTAFDHAKVVRQTSSAVNALDRSLATTDAQARRCPSGEAGLSCIVPLLREQSQSFARLDRSLRAIRYPSSVATQASAMEQAMARSAAIYLQLSEAATASQLVSEERQVRTETDRLRQRFNSQYQSLVRSL